MKKIPGLEYPDPTPLALPVRWKRPVPLSETIRKMVESENLRRAVESAGAETFDESNDFDVEDDVELKTVYEVDGEMVFPKEKAIHEARRILAERKQALKDARAAKKAIQGDVPPATAT